MNLWADLSCPEAQEQLHILLERPGVRIERIVSRGYASPPGFWYDQAQHEWVCVLAGKAVLQLEDRLVTLGAGDSFLLPAHTRHRVHATSSDPACLWLCVFWEDAPC
nr:cupin domain-containing protein [Maliibacterium massiliense]